MKKLIFTTLMLSLCSSIYATVRDTTVIEFNDKGIKKRIAIQSTAKNFIFNIPSSLTLLNVLKELGVDSLERDKTVLMLETGSKKDTIISIAKEGQSIKIVTKDFKGYRDTLNHKYPRRAYDEEQDSDRDEKPVRVRVDLENEKDGRENYDEEEETDDEEYRDYPKKKKSYSRYFPKKDTGFYLGLNGLKGSNNSLSTPELSTWGSRYVAISFRRNNTLSDLNDKTQIALSYGPEIAWYNFRFNNQSRAIYQGNTISLTKDEKIEKSKLVLPSINFPVLLSVGSHSNKYQLAFGVFGGFNLRNYTRTDYEDQDKVKEKSSFGAANLRFGPTVEVGKKNGLTFFFRGENNNLFESTSLSPFKNVKAWSIGLRL